MAKPVSSASKKETATAPARAAAPKAVRRGKPSAWRKFADQLVKANRMFERIHATAKASVNPDLSPAAQNDLTELQDLVNDQDLFGSPIKYLHALDAAEVPAGKPARPAKFATGDNVRITKAALPKYLKTGLYTAAELEDLKMEKVSPNGKECFCVTDNATEDRVHVRSMAHLEAR